MSQRLLTALALAAIAALPLLAADDAAESQVPPLEEGFNDEAEKSVNLALTPDEAHDKYLEDSRPAWYKRLPYGLGRGVCNIATCPGEFGRGYTWAFGEHEWYVMPFTGFVAGLGGTLSRFGAGMADCMTLGFRGDKVLADNYPSYVWQGQWAYGNRTAKDEEAERLAAEDAKLNVKSSFIPRDPVTGAEAASSANASAAPKDGSRIPSPTDRTKADPNAPSQQVRAASEAAKNLPGSSSQTSVRRENPVIRRYK